MKCRTLCMHKIKQQVYVASYFIMHCAEKMMKAYNDALSMYITAP